MICVACSGDALGSSACHFGANGWRSVPSSLMLVIRVSVRVLSSVPERRLVRTDRDLDAIGT